MYLSNYATIQIKDDLLRIDGVGNINYLGERDYSQRIWLDPDKMADRNITTEDVINAVKSQNVQVAAGTIGQPPVPKGQQFQLTMSTLGRLMDQSQFENIIVKTSQGNDQEGKSSAQIVRRERYCQSRIGLAAIHAGLPSRHDALGGLGDFPIAWLQCAAGRRQDQRERCRN